MKLSLKQVAIFGRVSVNVQSVDSKAIKCVSLLDLYKLGWWVTDRFGTIVTLVKPKAKLKDGFCCACRRIYTDVNLNTLDLLTQQYADAQYENYKKYLQSKRFVDKIKKSKEDYNASRNMSTLSQANKTNAGHVLFKTQKRVVRKVSTTKK